MTPDLTKLNIPRGSDAFQMGGDMHAEAPACSTAHIKEAVQFCYFIRLKMGGSTLGGFALLVHDQKFTEDELKVMCDDAAKITNEIRIVNRRKDMVANRVPIADVDACNEEFFGTDVNFFEAVMCDRYNFRIIRCATAIAEIEPTAKKKAAA